MKRIKVSHVIRRLPDSSEAGELKARRSVYLQASWASLGLTVADQTGFSCFGDSAEGTDTCHRARMIYQISGMDRLKAILVGFATGKALMDSLFRVGLQT